MLDILYSNKFKILENSLRFYKTNIAKNSNSYNLKIGCELEFFLLNKNGSKIFDNQILDKFCLELGCKREQGQGQLEITTGFTDDLFFLAQEIDNIKKNILKLADIFNLLVCFDGKPFLDDCGSSLQFNISIHDNNNYNLFILDNDLHKYCATSLLDLTNSMLLLLVPNSQDYQRFDLILNKNLFKQKKYTAPVNLSFGNDNRTCAIRFCKSSFGIENSKRLEYRVASANCDIWLSLSAIVLALTFGISDKKSHYDKIYGNAFEEIYDAQKILDNIAEASNIFFAKDNFLLEKMLKFIS